MQGLIALSWKNVTNKVSQLIKLLYHSFSSFFYSTGKVLNVKSHPILCRLLSEQRFYALLCCRCIASHWRFEAWRETWLKNVSQNLSLNQRRHENIVQFSNTKYLFSIKNKMCFYENYNISVISHFQRISLCLSEICERIQSQLQTKTKAKEDDLLTQFFRKL